MKSPRFVQMRCIYRGDKLHAQTSTLWTLCAALNERYPINLRPSGLTSWTVIVTNRKRYEVTCDCVWEAAETEGSKGGFGKPPRNRTYDRTFSAVITYPASM